MLDTGALVALLDRDEQWHAAAAEAVESLQRPLVTCEAVVVEACYLTRRMRGAAAAILGNVERGIVRIPLKLDDMAAPVAALMHKYRDLPADLADACLIHLADVMGTGDILTLDRHFATYRWRKTRAFRLLIEFN